MKMKNYIRPEADIEKLLIVNVTNADEGYEDSEEDFEIISGLFQKTEE